MKKTYSGKMFMRECGDKVWFVGVMDKPDELMTDERLRPFLIIPGKHQMAMMLIDPGEQTHKFRGYGANGIVTDGKWQTGTMAFDDLPPNLRALAYPFIEGEFGKYRLFEELKQGG